jgi:hypothetical protein
MKIVFKMYRCLVRLVLLLPFVVAPALAPTPALAAEPQAELDARIERLERDAAALRAEIEARDQRAAETERRTGILARELGQLREAIILPGEDMPQGQYGFAPAASKVYANRPGLSIGGYGEIAYAAPLADSGGRKGELDFGRLVLYTGFKFNEWIVFNSELEVEHATTADTVSGDGGVVALELANLDILLHQRINLGGLLLVPMGFINEIHEPPFFHGNDRPLVETEILPSTWRANGAGIFGELLPGLEYRTYGLTSFDAKGFRAEGLRLGKQGGSRELAEDWSWVLRFDYAAPFGTTFGSSLYLGDAGQGQAFGNDTEGYVAADVFTQIYEAHVEVVQAGVEFRALGAVALIDDAGILNSDSEILGYDPSQPPATGETRPAGGVSETLWGAYAEVAYDVLPHVLPETSQYLAPWFRYSTYDTQASVPRVDANRNLDREALEFGFSYKPIPQIVFKVDYRIHYAASGSVPDELRIGGGYVF